MDDEIQAELRGARAGDTEACLRAVRLLERAGRRDEVAAALRLRIEDARARQEIARLPGWGQFQSDGGRTSYCDVAPLRVEPREVWRASDAQGVVVANALSVAHEAIAIVGFSMRDEIANVVVRDPRTGEQRFMVNGHSPVLVEDVLLYQIGSELVGCDAWTGSDLWRVEARPHSEVLVGSGLLATSNYEKLVSVRTWDDPRRAPRVLWERHGAEMPTIGQGVALKARDGIVAYDIRNERLWEATGRQVLADSQGTVVVDPRAENATRELDRRGRAVWSSRGSCLALSPTLAVVRDRARLIVIDRQGNVVHEVDEHFAGVSLRGFAVARDVLYACSKKWVRASGLDGRLLWELPIECEMIVPVHEGLLVVSDDLILFGNHG